MCKLFVALMVAIIFSIVVAERIAKQSKTPCYSSGSQRNPLRKLLIGMRKWKGELGVMKQQDPIGLRETLLGKLIEKKGADYINSVEFGAAKCILLSFAEWITSSYPLMGISHITKAMVMEYLITIVRKARESGQPREYGFARLTAKILSVVTDIDIDVDTETTLMQQYSMYCPSCGILAKFVSDKAFYGRDFGGRYVYYCPKCNSRVGAYEGTPIPMGTMADQETLRLRKKCHEVFDRKWQNGQMTRDEAYVWLADVMKLQPYEAHIGKFGKRQCSKLLMLLGVSEKEQECVKKQSAVVSKAAAFA